MFSTVWLEMLGRVGGRVVNEFDFEERLAFSKGFRSERDEMTIRNLISGCIEVRTAPKSMDLVGVDYIATLRRGATLNVDVKAREVGCSQFWSKGEPELSLEIWSVKPENGNIGKAGWTLDESKVTDYTLHVFDPSDTDEVFLLPFQLLRMAFRKYLPVWSRHCRVASQSSNGGQWLSQCVFVRAWCVIDAITAEMRSHQWQPRRNDPEFRRKKYYCGNCLPKNGLLPPRKSKPGSAPTWGGGL